MLDGVLITYYYYYYSFGTRDGSLLSFLSLSFLSSDSSLLYAHCLSLLHSLGASYSLTLGWQQQLRQKEGRRRRSIDRHRACNPHGNTHTQYVQACPSFSGRRIHRVLSSRSPVAIDRHCVAGEQREMEGARSRMGVSVKSNGKEIHKEKSRARPSPTCLGSTQKHLSIVRLYHEVIIAFVSAIKIVVYRY